MADKTTSDHDEIRKWAEERGGKPAHVATTGNGADIGIVRLEFPGAAASHDANLAEISWEQFFEKFDQDKLALVYQEETAAGEKSNFNKIVSAQTAAKAAPRKARKKASRAPVKAAKKVAAPSRPAAKKAAAPSRPPAKKAPVKKTAVKKTALKKSAGKTAKKAAPAKKKMAVVAGKRTAKKMPVTKRTGKKVASGRKRR